VRHLGLQSGVFWFLLRKGKGEERRRKREVVVNVG
jgi:hypothetical protein